VSHRVLFSIGCLASLAATPVATKTVAASPLGPVQMTRRLPAQSPASENLGTAFAFRNHVSVTGLPREIWVPRQCPEILPELVVGQVQAAAKEQEPQLVQPSLPVATEAKAAPVVLTVVVLAAPLAAVAAAVAAVAVASSTSQKSSVPNSSVESVLVLMVVAASK